MRWYHHAIEGALGLAVVAAVSLIALDRTRQPSGGVRAEGSSPADYRVGVTVIEEAWAPRLTADLERCLRESRAGGVSFPPCRFSCTFVTDGGVDTHFEEAWSDPLPMAACEAWPKPETWNP